MEYPVDETLAAIRANTSMPEAWTKIVNGCKASYPQLPWNSLPALNFERDVAAAINWLQVQLEDIPEACVIYLGLDTINMRDGEGTNIEFGGTANCASLRADADWLVEARLVYGDSHLILGLYELKSVYETVPWEIAYDLCDYIFFLGYSGIVLADAFDRLPTKRTLIPVWGFHDGDLFMLGRKEAGKFIRICEYDENA
jgi:hypothetical protein